MRKLHNPIAMLRKNSYPIILLGFLAALLVFALTERIIHVYLEDDLLWMFPQITQLLKQGGAGRFLSGLFTGELALADGITFLTFYSLFKYNFHLYALSAVGLHIINALLFYRLLQRHLKFTPAMCLGASAIFLCFYAQFHAFTFLIAVHHLFVIFFILAVLLLYLKADEEMDKGSGAGASYWLALALCVPAALQRLSVLILPAIIFVHLFYTTRDKDKALRKYLCWSPLFAMFGGYQLYVLLINSHGDGLSRFVEPFDAFFKTVSFGHAGIMPSLIITAFLLAGGGFAFKYFAGRPFSRRCSAALGYLAYAAAFVPHLLVLCTALFLSPMASATGGSIERFHRMAYPVTGWPLAAEGIVAILALLAVAHAIRRGKHNMIIFFVWYIALVVFFLGDDEDVMSRYFIYLSPVFAAMFVYFFYVTVPGAVSWLRKKDMGAGLARECSVLFTAFILAACLVNLLAIKAESVRTLLFDYSWSYDYIKTAHLIQKDWERSKAAAAAPTTICVENLRHIPYKDGWEQSFLKSFDFGRYDSFRQTLFSVMGTDRFALAINKACPDGSLRYALNGSIVVGGDGRSVEPFYDLLDRAKAALRAGNTQAAGPLLQDAVTQGPFLFQFTGAGGNFSRGIYAFYGAFFDGDPKINYTADMVRSEVRDYAAASVLLAYCHRDDPATVSSLLKTGTAYASRDVIEEILDAIASDFPRDKNLGAFIRDHEKSLLAGGRSVRESDVEHYRGYRIYRYGEFYFGQPASKGPLALAYFRAPEHCADCFAARTRRAVRKSIDAATANTVSGPQPVSPEQSVVFRDGFRIILSGDKYYGLAEGPDAGTAEGLTNAAFEAQSLSEARQAASLYMSIKENARPPARKTVPAGGYGLAEGLRYKITLMHIPAGHLIFENAPVAGQENLDNPQLRIRPPGWLKAVSHNSVGADFASLTDAATLLPRQSEQTSVYNRKRGKSPRRIVYHHGRYFMERKGNEEDILADTRGIPSFLLWLSSQDYEQTKVIKTTLNINRDLYLAVGKVTALPVEGAAYYRLDIRIASLDSDKTSPLPLTVCFFRQKDTFIPASITFHMNGIPVGLTLEGSH